MFFSIQGDDKLPGGVAHGSDRGTGFTREEVKPKYVNLKAPDAYDRLTEMPGLKADRTRRQDPVEYLNMQFPHNKTRSVNIYQICTLYRVCLEFLNNIYCAWQ